jgi:hypothetical protein
MVMVIFIFTLIVQITLFGGVALVLDYNILKR